LFDGVKSDPCKVSRIENWRTPSTVTDVRSLEVFWDFALIIGKVSDIAV